MATIKKEITINAPVDEVFKYLSMPTNITEIWPSFVEAKDVKRLPNGGSCFNYAYKMAGVRFKGASEDIEFIPNQRVVNKSKGGIEAIQTYTYKSEGKGTKLTWEIEYKVPIPLLGKLAEAIIVRMNDREAELVLANLKEKMEV